MRNLLIALMVIGLSIAVYEHKNTSSSTKPLTLSEAIGQCSKKLDINLCSVESIRDNITSRSVVPNSGFTIWSADNDLINLTTGEKVKLNIDGLNPYQFRVWNSYLAEHKKNAQRNNLMGNVNMSEIIIYIILLLGLVLFIFIVIPFVWRFFLRRVSEFSKAVKGDKLD